MSSTYVLHVNILSYLFIEPIMKHSCLQKMVSFGQIFEDFVYFCDIFLICAENCCLKHSFSELFSHNPHHPIQTDIFSVSWAFRISFFSLNLLLCFHWYSQPKKITQTVFIFFIHCHKYLEFLPRTLCRSMNIPISRSRHYNWITFIFIILNSMAQLFHHCLNQLSPLTAPVVMKFIIRSVLLIEWGYFKGVDFGFKNGF